jgi:hypothetical protein
MNSKYLIPAVAFLLVFTVLFSTALPALAIVTRATIGPKLVVTTIPQDDQKREKGIIVLGLVPTVQGFPKPRQPGFDLMSQHKILVTFNGQTLLWRVSGPNTGEYAAPTVSCNVLEKDKVNPMPHKDGTTSKQFPAENLKTKLVDVSDKFICKVRWKTPANLPGWLESVGVLDVYYTGPTTSAAAWQWIADHILTVTVTLVLGRTYVQGTDIQDICVLGWSMANNVRKITKPDGGTDFHWSWDDALGPFVGCEEAAIWQRYYLGHNFQQDIPAD